MNHYIGVDLGGTHVRVAKIDENGNILQDEKRPSLAQEGPEKVVANIIDMIAQIEDVESCKGIGIGVPGPVDVYRNVMTMSTNLPGFTDLEFAKEITERFGIPTYLDNDANVAGLAEALVGAGKGLPIVYYLTHSTGIGGALVVDGKVVSGRNGYAGEVANIIIDRDRKKYNHLNVGAVENEASGTAITRIGKEVIGEEIKSARDVFDLARQNDERALKIIDTMAYDFAQALSAIAHVTDPHMFVIGGGVSNAHELYFDKVKEYYNSLVHEGMKNVPIVTAVLKEPGVIGAAMLVKSRG